MIHDYSNYEFLNNYELKNLKEENICELCVSGKYNYEDIYIFFLTNYIYLKNNKDYINAAKLAYLISYYIFILWTPARSEFLSKYYIEIAIQLDPNNKEYVNFYNFILSGN